ncbi:RAP domain-containing protein [Theileria equi strain WA]|uniref:RAP domain-containing protein n=1 Tax=Theileria equi strain WA TaxID=1537102 RepID=L0B0S7_THEEQ|nr:RAP domain-containing protein [Theileria equi strain WA]AFZ80744.1 RAP domain-containing protein [Theileria equi strain WA]|eukprot:XP_004830410.1 RAP domain-containing protein [Theileria equi strain WA]
MPLIRHREKAIKRAVKHEAVIRRIGRRIHKRFRSWTQQRVRKFWLPAKVSLHSPMDLLDGWLLSAAVQKAATIRKHDLRLWHNFGNRFLEIANTLTGQQLGYLYYGFGKSRFLHEPLYIGMMKHTEPMLTKLNSHSLMCVAWALNRLQIRNQDFLTKYSFEIASRLDDIRVTDLIKICNSLAKLDVCSPVLKDKLSEKMVDRLETIFAQDFRGVMNLVTMMNMYDEKTQVYILSRFSKIFICARPQHLHQAFTSAVGIRVLLQRTWAQLDKSVKGFYTRLSMRKIHQPSRKPSDFQWDVSDHLAKMGLYHRNTFYWGCFWIDIGEVEEKNNCWFVDGPCCFYVSSTEYTSKVKLQHRILDNLGWNIRRVPWFKWANLLNDPEGKIAYLRKLRDSEPLGEFLSQPEVLSPSEIKLQLNKIKNHYKSLESSQ